MDVGFMVLQGIYLQCLRAERISTRLGGSDLCLFPRIRAGSKFLFNSLCRQMESLSAKVMLRMGKHKFCGRGSIQLVAG